VKLICAISFITIMTLVSYEAGAVKVRASASVEIVEPLGFSEQSGFGTYYINRSNSILKKALGTPSKGSDYSKKMPESEYRISGSKSNSIQINVASSSNERSKVKIDDFVLNYYNGADLGENGIVKSAPGRDAKLKLGATLKVKSDAESGYYAPDFNIAIYYE